MWESADAVAELSGLISECRSRTEYEAARLEWLERAIGFEISYFGAASPEQAVQPVVKGVAQQSVEVCEARADRYWQDRLALQHAARSMGGVVADHQALSAKARDQMPFYREVVSAQGIRATAVSMLRSRGRFTGCVYLGRTSRGVRFRDRELELLRRALPVISLGDAVHAALESPGATAPPSDMSRLTEREQQVLSLLCCGWTNAQIAAELGSSPRTVKNQVSAILNKTNTDNRTQLTALFARRQRLA